MSENVESPNVDVNKTLNELSESVQKIQDDLNEFKKETHEKFESIGKQSKIQRVKDEEKVVLVKTSGSPRQFIIKTVFENVSKLANNGRLVGQVEEYCGVPWRVTIKRYNESLAVYLWCEQEKKDVPWSIETDVTVFTKHPNGESVEDYFSYCYEEKKGRGFPKFLKWEEMEKDYLVGGKLIVEIHVDTNRMTGIYKEDARKFDSSNEECSDVVLQVDYQNFYVSKLYLATHSPYFKALFLHKFAESEKSEIKLNGVGSEEFQKYLEVLYAESLPDESTVEGILHIADMYDTPLVVKRCREFLLEKSKKTPKKMLEMAVRYNLEKLKKKIFDGIKTVDDIKAVLPGDTTDMDPSIMAILFKKSLDAK